jgi:hypothetical protein
MTCFIGAIMVNYLQVNYGSQSTDADTMCRPTTVNQEIFIGVLILQYSVCFGPTLEKI